MVGFLREPTIDEELNQQPPPSELKKSDDPFPPDLEIDDFALSFADSLLDFDCLSDWIEVNPGLGMADSNSDSEKVGSVDLEGKDVEGCLGMTKEGSCRETGFGHGFQNLGDLSRSIEEEIGKVTLDGGLEEDGQKSPGIAGANSSNKVEVGRVRENGVKSGQLVSVVEDDGKVKNGGETLGIDESGGKSGEMDTVIGDGSKKSDERESDGDESDGTSDSDSSCSSSSSSEEEKEDSDDDDDEEEEEEGTEDQEKEEAAEGEGEIDIEEGEIRDSEVEQIVAWSGDEDDEEDGGVKGPIRSKNELQVLPPVPTVNATLQPHHQTVPVGAILSILGTQVIVEGIEKHNPLSDGSILWITESRCPLGLVDEIFGPVKNPYYMVRYNSENDIPAGIKQGTSISFVPEFANHVLNDSNLYRKGYDASGENDEEVTDEAEFSDDEKEAEYKRMLKTSRRGTSGPNLGNKKKERKFKNRGGAWQQNSRPSTPQTAEGVHQPPINRNQQFTAPPIAAVQDHGNGSYSFGRGQGFTGGPGLVPPFPQPFQAPGFIPPSSGVWTNAMPFEQQQNMVFPFGVPTNGMPWLQQNHQQQQSYQIPFPNGMPFQQQFVPGQMLPPNVISPGGQPNFCAGPPFAPWPGSLGQNNFNQPLGMGWQSQQPPMSMNLGEQPRPSIQGNVEVPREFNQGTNRGRGRKPFHRGGGRFGGGRGGRGQRQSK